MERHTTSAFCSSGLKTKTEQHIFNRLMCNHKATYQRISLQHKALYVSGTFISMFQLLKKYDSEIHHYYSDCDIYTLKLQMKDKFEKLNKLSSLSTNLQGRFTNHHEFQIKPKVQIGYSKNIGRPSLHISGELIADGARTEIIINVVPFPFKGVIIASVFLGMLGIYRAIENQDFFVLSAALCLLSVIPMLILKLIKYEKNNIRQNFAREFGFKYVKTY